MLKIEREKSRKSSSKTKNRASKPQNRRKSLSSINGPPTGFPEIKGAFRKVAPSAPRSLPFVQIDETESDLNSSISSTLNNNIEEETKTNNNDVSGIVFHEIVDESRFLIHDPDFFVTIERDYSGRVNGDPLQIRFLTNYQSILDPLISLEEFEKTMTEVNALFQKAQTSNWKSYLQNFLTYITCTLINLCRKSRLEKAIDDIAVFLYNENDSIYHPRGLHVVHPYACALRRIVIRSIAHCGLYEADPVDPDDTDPTSKK